MFALSLHDALPILGGSKVHNSKSGNAHINAKDEAEALNKVRAILSYLPGSNADSPPITSYDKEDDHNRSELTEIVPYDATKTYDVRSEERRVGKECR